MISKQGTTYKIASNTIYQIIGKVFSMSITVFATIIITRYYGREGYGEFSLMQTWPALFFIIVDFGINAIATREISKDWELANRYFGNILAIRLAFSGFLIMALTLLLFLFPYSQPLRYGIILSLFLIMTQSLYTTTNIIFQVKLRYDLSTIGYSAGYITILILILLLSRINSDIMWVNFSYVIGGVVTFLINLAFIKQLGLNISLRFDKDIWFLLVSQSIPLGMMFIFSQINFKSDSIFLSVLKLPEKYGLSNTESVAVYSLGYKVFEVSLVIPTFLMNAVFPVFVRHLKESKEKFINTFKKTILFLFGSGILVGISGIILAPFMIKFLGGEEFAQSVTVLRLLMAGLFIYYLTQPISWFIVTLGNQKSLPKIYLISAIFNVSANYFFIQIFSFYSSTIITHLSEFIILILLAITARKVWKEYA